MRGGQFKTTQQYDLNEVSLASPPSIMRCLATRTTEKKRKKHRNLKIKQNRKKQKGDLRLETAPTRYVGRQISVTYKEPIDTLL